jgi:hypothetical protein
LLSSGQLDAVRCDSSPRHSTPVMGPAGSPVTCSTVRSPPSAKMVAPALPSRLAWLASDTDRTREVADERLSVVLDQLEETGTPTEGTVGADDPMLAFEDAVTDFHPHHILVALRGPDESGWQERGLVEKVFERFGLSVTVFAIPS